MPVQNKIRIEKMGAEGKLEEKNKIILLICMDHRIFKVKLKC